MPTHTPTFFRRNPDGSGVYEFDGTIVARGAELHGLLQIVNAAGAVVAIIDPENGGGIFQGTVIATDGSFTGHIVATSGTFTGAVFADSGSFVGAIHARSLELPAVPSVSTPEASPDSVVEWLQGTSWIARLYGKAGGQATLETPNGSRVVVNGSPGNIGSVIATAIGSRGAATKVIVGDDGSSDFQPAGNYQTAGQYSRGTATLHYAANNDASVTVPHGLGSTPTAVQVTPRTAGGSSIAAPACTSRDGTNITISARTFNGANQTMDIVVDWVAYL